MDNIINEVYNQYNLKKHEYFIGLQAGKIDKQAFIASQQQMYWAVEFFSKPMCILASKISDINLRTNIAKNIWEEHGEGNIQLAHANTFITFLSILGVQDESYLQTKNISVAINSFNSSLSGACHFYSVKFSAAVLGIIEKLFIDASDIINNVVITNQWVKQKDMVHYDEHKVLDVEHAQDFFHILESQPYSSDDISDITQGLQLGAHIFNQLYDGLLAIAKNNYV